MPESYTYSTIASHPLAGDAKPEPEALAQMRKKSRTEWPDCKWAAFQCVDLSSLNIGHLQFLAIGPGRGVSCVTQLKGPHWSYYFVGFVNLDTGLIESFTPEPASAHA
jgi:hypothetical protein